MSDYTELSRQSRFADIDLFPADRPPLIDFDKQPLVSFDQALAPIHKIINGLHWMKDQAFKNCHYPDYENNLSRDESGSIYLYTMEGGSPSFYGTLNKTLRVGDPMALEPWILYVKLLDTAFKKLPNKKENVWRGIDAILDKNAYHEGRLLTWWGVDSCSRKREIAIEFMGGHGLYGTLFFIEAINGKDVRKYSQYPIEEEIILIPGSRLRVLTHTTSLLGNIHYVHMCETDGNASHEILQESSLTTHHQFSHRQFGSLNLGNGVQYQGDIFDGKPHGYGSATQSKGGYYIGEWKNGVTHGEGTMMQPDGTTYNGGFIDGKRSGEGVLTWPNKKQYKGAWSNNRETGPGQYYDEEGRTECVLTKENILVLVPRERQSVSIQTGEEEEKEEASCTIS